MTRFVSLMEDPADVSKEAFKARLNEIYLGLPQNVGDGFFKWWCESIHKKEPKFSGVTPVILKCWLEGKYVPAEQLRREFLIVASDIVKCRVMSEREFLYHVRYCKGHLDVYFENKDPEVIAWADDYLIHRLCLETPADEVAVRAWFTDQSDVYFHVPRIALRMMTIRVAAQAVAETIARDRYGEQQGYEQFDHEAIFNAHADDQFLLFNVN